MPGAPSQSCRSCGAPVRPGEPACSRCLLAMVANGSGTRSEDEIFQQALDLEPADREQFILDSTTTNSAQRSAILKMLAGYEESVNERLDPGANPGTDLTSPATGNVEPGERPGGVIDHFRLINLLGEGGMGSVWRAEQIAPVRREVALKIIKLGMDTREVVRRFGRERQTLALLSHPNIAQVFEAGATESGRPYFAMELVNGESITSHCAKSGPDITARLLLFLEVCAAVEHAHQKGVIHRDLKPSNILVANGRVKVIDFGVAKATQQPGDTLLHTHQAQILGTPAYMSPEQARSSGLDIDTRTDVYALGVVLYELLTGTLPIDSARFSGMGVAEIQRLLLEEEPPTPSARVARKVSGPGEKNRASGIPNGSRDTALPQPAVAGDVDLKFPGDGQLSGEDIEGVPKVRPGVQWRLLKGDLDWVVMKAIRKERDDRYPSAAALAQDITRYLAGEPVSAAPPTLGYRAGKFMGRHRIAVASACAVFLALTAGVVISTRMALEARRASANEKSARQETLRTLGRMYTRLALNHGSDGRPAEAALWSAKAAEVSRDDLQEHESNLKRAALWTQEVPVPLRAFNSKFHEIRKMIFHPGERHLIAESRTGDREVWDLDLESRMSFGGTNQFETAAWSSDGKWLAAAIPGTGEVSIHKFPDGELVQSLALGSANLQGYSCSGLSFNCDGSMIAIGTGSSLRIFRRETGGKFTHLLSLPQPREIRRVVFSPTDPNNVATALTNNLACLYSVDPATTNYITLFAEERHQFAARRIDSGEPPHFDREGRTITLTRHEGTEDYGLATYDAGSGAVQVKHQGLRGFVLAHSPDGRFVLYRHEKANHTERVSIADAASGADVATTSFNRIATVADFSQDGRQALVGSEDGQAIVLRAPDWKPEFHLSLHQSRIMGVAMAPSGRIGATAQAGGLVRIWRTTHPHRTILPVGHDTRTTFSSDGRFFALSGRTSPDSTLDFTRVYQTSDHQPAGPAFPTFKLLPADGRPRVTSQASPSGLIMDAAFSPDGNTLVLAQSAAGESKGSSRDFFTTNLAGISFWNWRTGERLGEPIPTPSEPRSLTWRADSDGREVAVICAGGQYLVIDHSTHAVRLLYQQGAAWGARNPLNNGEITCSGDGSILAAWGIQKEIQVWAKSAENPQKLLQHHRIDLGTLCADLAISEQGMIAMAQTGTRDSNPKVLLLNASTGVVLPDPLNHPEWMNSVAFNATGGLLLTTARDGFARIWDWRSRKLHCQPVQHRGSIHAGRFLPGTPFAVTGGENGMFGIFDARTGVEVASFNAAPHQSQILETQVSPDGRVVLLGGKGVGGVGIVRLDALHQSSGLGLEGLLKLTSINASANVDQESGLVAQSAEEWLSNWRQFRQSFPRYHQF